MNKTLVSLIMALVALFAVTAPVQAFVPENGIKLEVVPIGEVGQGPMTVVARYKVVTTLSRILTDSWQVGLQVSQGLVANDLGTVYWQSSGRTVAYSEVFAHMFAPNKRMTILTPDQQNWGEASFQSEPLRNGDILSIAVDTSTFPDGATVSVNSVVIIGFDMDPVSPTYGEFVWQEAPGGVTSTVTVRAPQVQSEQIVEPTPVVATPVVTETLFTSTVIHRQDVTFNNGNPGLFLIFSEPIPSGATIRYLDAQLHWAAPVFLIIQGSAFFIEGNDEIVDYKIILP